MGRAQTGTDVHGERIWQVVDVVVGGTTYNYGFESPIKSTDAVNLGRKTGVEATTVLFDTNGEIKANCFLGVQQDRSNQYPKCAKAKKTRAPGGVISSSKITDIKAKGYQVKGEEPFPYKRNNGIGSSKWFGVTCSNGVMVGYNKVGMGAQGGDRIAASIKTKFEQLMTELSSETDFNKCVVGASVPRPKLFQVQLINAGDDNNLNDTYQCYVNHDATLPESTATEIWTLLEDEVLRP